MSIIKTTTHDNDPKSNYYSTKAEWIYSKSSIDQKNNLRLIKLFQNEQGTLLNKVKQLITASPKITAYLLLSQLHPI